MTDNPAARPARAIALLLGAMAVAGCASVPKLGPRPEPRSAADLASGLEAPATAWPDARWWEGYGDPELGALIEEALASSPTMDEAAARVRRASAAAQQAGAATKPQLSASAQGGLSQQSTGTIDLPPGIDLPHRWSDAGQAALSFSFDLDLWGKNKATLKAALSEEEAARADAAQARLVLSTGIAAAYADLATLAAIRSADETWLRIRGKTLGLMRERAEAGLENEAAVMRALSGRAAAAAELAAIDEQIALIRNRLAALVGGGPERGRSIVASPAARLGSYGLPADLGLAIIGRRPDIVAARLRAEAAGSRIKAAKADFYPNVRLSALIGVQALGLASLLDGGSVYGSAGPAISLPIFSGGRIEGGYRGARADYDIAVADYDSTLIDAIREIADVAERQRALKVRLAESRLALDSAGRAQRLVEARYKGGLATYLDVLSAEDSLNSSRRAVAELETSAFALDVALVRALGGGFRDTPARS